MTDDISMGALTGTVAERTKAALVAGCDLVLHCNGNLDEMVDVAENCPELSGVSLARTQGARDWQRKIAPGEVTSDKIEIFGDRLDRLLARFDVSDA